MIVVLKSTCTIQPRHTGILSVFFSRYGVIHGTGEMELQPLDKHIDEDEEDMTLFDVKDAKRPR